ncbi:MAG: peptidoglycan editing factor PgeF [Pseudomonadota bacterium]
MPDSPLLLDVDWPAPAGVRAACSLREGGVSRDAYASLNLGDHVGDDPDCVARNRARFAAALGARPVFLKQVHGTGVAALDASTPDGTEADACFTDTPGIACTIMVADCMPVLFACEGSPVVGAAHAGWRGLAGAGGRGVLEALWAAMRERLPADAARHTVAWLGPCIGPRAFEVGPEVRDAFAATDPSAAGCFVPHPHNAGKWLADLPALVRLRLRALGIEQVSGNDGGDAWCTVANASRFFSHRRDRVSGRFAAAVWRTA